ncbi:MAG: DNA repair protein RadC [Desulfobacterales bacterium]|nr:DNA repair protein RadC [Desulfobacterales bacterium]
MTPDSTAAISEPKNLRSGHRVRLRERLLKAGRIAFADHELLELLLTYAIPYKDTKATAKLLIERFGSFAAIFDQPRERLLEVKGVGPYCATFFLAIREFMVRYLEQEVEYTHIISQPEDIAVFVRTHLAANQREYLMILCLNNANQLLYHTNVIEGTVDRAPFYPREILKVALLHNATRLILVHNHPGGDPIPSENDHLITRRLEQLALEFDIRLFDHLIVTPRKAFSLFTGRYV